MTSLVVATFISFLATPALASWLIYYKPAFKGKVIDAETKKPIEGAVVVVAYDSRIFNPVGAISFVVKVKETLTDDRGEFFFSSYFTIINPISLEDYAQFIIYKPGYGSFQKKRMHPPNGISSPTIERFFMAENFDKQGEVSILDFGRERGSREYRQKVVFGLVELPPLRTRKERLRTVPISPGVFGSKELPLLFKAINEERKDLLGKEK